jgi:hypothetical protein
MASVSESMDEIIYVGVGIFILILLLSLSFQGYGASKNILNTTYQPSILSNSNTGATTANQFNANTVNSLILTCTGTACSWPTASAPLTVKVTGNVITTYATNAVYAAALGRVSNTFTVTSSVLTPVTLGSNAGDFYNFSAINVSGALLSTQAAPGATWTVSEGMLTTTHGSVPAAYYSNSISESQTLGVYAGVPGAVNNFTTYAGPLPNTFGGALQLAVFALVFIAVIVAIVGSLRGRGTGVSGGFLQS